MLAVFNIFPFCANIIDTHNMVLQNLINKIIQISGIVYVSNEIVAIDNNWRNNLGADDSLSTTRMSNT